MHTSQKLFLCSKAKEARATSEGHCGYCLENFEL